MYCRNCGNEVDEKAQVCVGCGVNPLNGAKHCQECGAETSEKQEVCTQCGCRLKTKAGAVGGANDKIYPTDPPKSGVTAVLLTCLITGIGQIYLGQTLKGLTWLVGAIVAIPLTAGLLALPIWIACMIDAHKIAKKLAAGNPVGQWEFF